MSLLRSLAFVTLAACGSPAVVGANESDLDLSTQRWPSIGPRTPINERAVITINVRAARCDP